MVNYNKIHNKWDFYTYPWRPNTDIINEIIKYKKLRNNTLILGSTKEFREIFKKFSPYICDSSKKMYDSLSVGNENEKFLNNNWFELNSYNFDLIIGDLTLLMFNDTNKKKLINTLIDNLSNSGEIIIRIIVKKENTNIDKKILFILKQIGNYENIIDFFNYLTFELVNGLGYSRNIIYKKLNLYNKNLAELYKKDFYSLTPYGQENNYIFNEENFQEFNIGYNIKILNHKNHLFVKEYLICIKK